MRTQTRCGNKSQKDGDQTQKKFIARIVKLISENVISEIYNADQTAVNYEFLGKKTINASGEKRIWIRTSGHEKQRATAMLLADSNGKKYPLFMVLKISNCTSKMAVDENLTMRNGIGKIVWKEVLALHEKFPARLYANPTARWNTRISIEFLNFHFGWRKGKTLKPILLLWDDFAPHFCNEVESLAKSLSIMLAKIPPGFTWICQPADVAWMKPFKASLHSSWISHLRQSVKNHDRSSGAFKLMAPTRHDIVEWASNAWGSLSSNTIINSFKKCQLIPSSESPNEVLGTEVDCCDIGNDLVDEIVQIASDAGAVRSEEDFFGDIVYEIVV
ncbi:hypothetical protein AeRB84_011292 [Aphanomyces euteiches]|nr:hypothetical protein AeRB84_011292 [Aphanomyces euteiches]